MSIDTEIKGDADGVARAASFLMHTLSSEVRTAAGALDRVSSTPGWEGEAASSFGGWAADAAGRAEQAASAVNDVAGTLRTFALALKSNQDRMKDIRADARAADLDVAGFVIQDPGPGPAAPRGIPPAVGGLKVSAATKAQHAAAVRAYEEHQRKVEAYREAKEKADDVEQDMRRAGNELSDKPPSTINLVLNGLDLAAGLAVGGAAGKAMLLRKAAQANLDTERSSLRRLSHDAETQSRVRRAYEERTKPARREVDVKKAREKGLGRLGKVGGGAFALAGGIADYASGDKSAGQAAASSGAGFLASVGAGAGMGALGGSIGGPPGAFVGGVGGAVVGAAAGIFTSGVVDDLWKNGPSLENLGEGAEAVYETGKGVVGGAIKGVGSGLETAGGVAEDVGGFLNPLD